LPFLLVLVMVMVMVSRTPLPPHQLRHINILNLALPVLDLLEEDGARHWEDLHLEI